MADAEIQILIKAVDEMSSTLKKVETNIGTMTKNSEKQTKSLGSAFTKLQGDLLILGNAASRVDSIFSSYVSMQLRLENATERVIGAQDRLTEAQDRLTEAQSNQERMQISLERLSLKEEDVKNRLVVLYQTLTDMNNRGIIPSSKRYQDTLKVIQEEELNLKEISFERGELQKKASSEVEKAQTAVERATRSLTI